MSTRRQQRLGLLVRLSYAVCLLGATVNHARVVATHGLVWDYGGVPAASAAFWTSLTLLDPLAAILLIARPNMGVMATAAIIVADVTHNLWLTARHVGARDDLAAAASNPFIVSQVAFLVFVTATLPLARERRGASLNEAKQPFLL